MTLTRCLVFQVLLVVGFLLLFSSLTEGRAVNCKTECNYYDNGTFPHCMNCHQFVMCSHGNYYVMDCPVNLLWDIELDTCNYPRAATCRCAECGNPIRTRPPQNPGFGCPSTMCQGHVAALLPHCSDCSKYVRCRHGVVAEVKQCDYGYLFDVYEKRCKPRDSAVCVSQPTAYPTRRPTYYPTKRPTYYTTKRPTYYPTQPSGCPDDICYGYGKLYRPHCYDCHKFVKCENNRIVYSSDCAYDYIFDIRTSRCKPAPDAVCGSYPTKKTTYYTTKMPTYYTTKMPTYYPPKEHACPDDICYGPGSPYRPHCSDCHKFVMCTDNRIAATYECAHDYLFDIRVSRCKPASEAVCKTNQGPYPAKTNAPYHPTNAPVRNIAAPANCISSMSQCEGRPDTKYPYCYDCASFVQCFRGKGYHSACPQSTTWDVYYNKCTRQAKSCWTMPTTKRYHTTTDMYYHTTAHHYYPDTTMYPPGHHYPNQPGHHYPNQPGHNYPNQPGHHYPNQPGHHYPNQPGHTYPNQPGHQYPHEQMPPAHVTRCVKSCAGLPEGVYGLCDDCSQFLMCSNRETVYTCPPNTFFNYYLQTCIFNYRC